MSHLLVKSKTPDATGCRQSVKPENSTLKYVGFELFELKSGMSISQQTGDLEVCLVMVTGSADVKAGDQKYLNIGSRKTVFDSIAPHAVYLPNDSEFTVTAIGDLTLAVCTAPGFGNHPVRLIKPEDMSQETRGKGANVRHVCNILPDDQPADSLLVVEVITPNGNCSSYPPHKHDQDNLPHESFLEETYYHRIDPPQGFAFQRVYTDDRSLDETMTVEDGDVVQVPKGYHPVGTLYGYDLYYLNVMAGPIRKWQFNNDKDHEWIIDKA
ncbi:MAG: 5-deoxy-glucuronate isomerase [Rhizobiales bacterium]|nr:5-deoxy-glucuronate isomerase [Hyphomicrobiales bacterium]NRB15602.1 5-deoxy-glucuronate isomerase [Hyphomicrobiales bacterium]